LSNTRRSFECCDSCWSKRGSIFHALPTANPLWSTLGGGEGEPQRKKGKGEEEDEEGGRRSERDTAVARTATQSHVSCLSLRWRGLLGVCRSCSSLLSHFIATSSTFFKLTFVPFFFLFSSALLFTHLSFHYITTSNSHSHSLKEISSTRKNNLTNQKEDYNPSSLKTRHVLVQSLVQPSTTWQ
jgi:hypothetical protein